MGKNSKLIAYIFDEILWALVGVILLPFASPCQDNSLSYQKRGNRYEGFRVIEVSSGPTFEELSFIRGKPLADFKSEVVLNVSFYLPYESEVYIKAKELVPMKHYEMRSVRVDWSQGWNTFSPWETSSVIIPLGIPLVNIGVLARIGNDRLGSGEIAAVQFEKFDEDVNSSAYEFQFRTKYDFKKVYFEVKEATSGKTVQSGILSDVIGGTSASVSFELKNQDEGQYRLLLDCLYKGRKGGPQRNYLFYHVKK